MKQAVPEISTTGERFSARNLYAATNGRQSAARRAELRSTTLDMISDAFIGSGELRIGQT